MASPRSACSSSSSAKECLLFVCDVLKSVGCTYDCSAELLRQGKFNQKGPQVVLLRLLHDVLILQRAGLFNPSSTVYYGSTPTITSAALEQQRCTRNVLDSSWTKLCGTCDTEGEQDEKTPPKLAMTFVQSEMRNLRLPRCQYSYRVASFFSMTSETCSSRELLLALAWLLAGLEVLDIFIAHRIDVLLEKLTSYIKSASVATESNDPGNNQILSSFALRQDTSRTPTTMFLRHTATRTVYKFLSQFSSEKRQPVNVDGNTEELCCGALDCLLQVHGRLMANVRELFWQSRRKHILLHQLRKSSGRFKVPTENGCDRKPSMLELHLLRHPKELYAEIDRLRDCNKVISAIEQMLTNSAIFWAWAQSVLIEKLVRNPLTNDHQLPQVNPTLDFVEVEHELIRRHQSLVDALEDIAAFVSYSNKEKYMNNPTATTVLNLPTVKFMSDLVIDKYFLNTINYDDGPVWKYLRAYLKQCGLSTDENISFPLHIFDERNSSEVTSTLQKRSMISNSGLAKATSKIEALQRKFQDSLNTLRRKNGSVMLELETALPDDIAVFNNV